MGGVDKCMGIFVFLSGSDRKKDCESGLRFSASSRWLFCVNVEMVGGKKADGSGIVVAQDDKRAGFFYKVDAFVGIGAIADISPKQMIHPPFDV